MRVWRFNAKDRYPLAGPRGFGPLRNSNSIVRSNRGADTHSKAIIITVLGGKEERIKEPFNNTPRKEKEHSSYAGKAEAESIC